MNRQAADELAVLLYERSPRRWLAYMAIHLPPTRRTLERNVGDDETAEIFVRLQGLPVLDARRLPKIFATGELVPCFANFSRFSKLFAVQKAENELEDFGKSRGKFGKVQLIDLHGLLECRDAAGIHALLRAPQKVEMSLRGKHPGHFRPFFLQHGYVQ